MDNLPRHTVAVTFTDAEIERLDQLCDSQGDVPRDTIILWALIAYDKLITNKEDSVFQRRAT